MRLHFVAFDGQKWPVHAEDGADPRGWRLVAFIQPLRRQPGYRVFHEDEADRDAMFRWEDGLRRTLPEARGAILARHFGNGVEA